MLSYLGLEMAGASSRQLFQVTGFEPSRVISLVQDYRRPIVQRFYEFVWSVAIMVNDSSISRDGLLFHRSQSPANANRELSIEPIA
jgi:hypothetical protein